ncbi:bifunctional diguanylate cyclase/phosphodiesterase [Aliidiomarina celeris]|uniref:bifunctional diguanylate cyclase/phosphodiesterase n=1 Tax=Aliidiomarina celeris TaxID=2249428 RepID=UPI000DE8B82C|nr:EAL domain-containing protein [Aliidiomarina celeris]
MDFLAFVNSSHDLATAYAGYHVPWLVVLSLVMAILAAFASLFHTDLMRIVSKPWQRQAWHFSGSVAMGLGVWAMHFIGMVSFRMDVPVVYSPSITALSVIPAFLAAWVTLSILYKNARSVRSVLLGGLFMGAGIGVMHYTGMAAIQTEAQMLYLPSMFLVSIVVAVVLASLALSIRPMLETVIKSATTRLMLSAVVMGLAVASMHYTAMHATVFLPSAQSAKQVLTGADANQLVLSTLIVAMFIVFMSTVVVVMMNRQQRLQMTADQRGEQVQALTERLTKVAERVPGMVYQLQRDDKGYLSFSYLSEAARPLFGVEPKEAMANAGRILSLVPERERAKIVESLSYSAHTMQAWNHEFPVETPNEGVKWLSATSMPQREPNGGVSWSGFISDITEKRRSEETIHRLAYYDSLTELPNRRYVIRELNERLSTLVITKRALVVLVVNLDGFKRINDVHGQQQGDALLKASTQRMQRLLITNVLLARLTADEFVIVAECDTQQCAIATAERLADRVLKELSKPFDLPRLRHQGSASIGITSAESDAIGAEELLRRADLAVNKAKQEGGGQFYLYHPDIEQEISARFSLEADLREALSSEQFVLFYQMQCDENGEYLGAEALIRWLHPQRGMVSPAEFIPVAEDSGLIVPLGEWVLKEACKQLAKWQAHKHSKHWSLSINVSARQFYQHNFVELVLDEIAKHNLPHHLVKLELTESLVLEDMDAVVKKMRVLKNSGVRFSMDDFGTGYSSLSYLSSLPFNEVKIDQAFIRRASTKERERDWTIVEAIIGITKNLGMEVIAEGVETKEQQQRLAQSGCLRFQGYLFSRPAPADELPKG